MNRFLSDFRDWGLVLISNRGPDSAFDETGIKENHNLMNRFLSDFRDWGLVLISNRGPDSAFDEHQKD